MSLLVALGLAAALGFRMAFLAVRLPSKRRSGRALALVCAADGLAATYFAIAHLAGIAHDAWLGPLVALADATVASTSILSFAYTFPEDRRLSPVLLAVAIIGAPATIVVALATGRFDLAQLFPLACGTSTVVLLALRWTAHRGSKDAVSIALMFAAVLLRFVSGVAVGLRVSSHEGTHGVPMELFEARRTVVPIATDILASIVLLRSESFGAWSRAAKAAFSVGAAFGTIALAILGIDAALRSVTDPGVLRLGLLGAAAIPFATYLAWTRLGPRVEALLLAPFDPHRALRRDAVEDVARAAAGAGELEAFIDVVRDALGRITGSSVRFVPQTSEQREPHVGERSEHGLALRRGAVLHGALVFETRQPHLEALDACVAIADQLAMRLEHEALFADRMKIASELHAAQRLAALGSFAAAIAHDIRTPLTSVQMNVQILRSKSTLGPDDTEHFDIALAELSRLDATAGAILEYAKPVNLYAVTVALDDVVSDSLRSMRAQLVERRLRVESSTAGPTLVVRGDVQKLRRVVENLLANAAEASPDDATIIVRTSECDGRAVLEVQDSGRGISPEDLPQIFEPFYTKRVGGTGLGLAIVRRLVRAHDGEVFAANAPDGGATFTVILPMCSVSAPAETT
ncbi:MAG: hypothetical protein HOW73_02990 [Polyangiaceae bacterium]|nr:hypothetical protein [Polyangiaceae bacterium]